MALALFSAVFVCLLAAYFWLKSRRPKNFPPGPQAIPFIGNLLSLGPKPHLTTIAWREKYGDTFGFYNGRKPVVVLSNFNTIRKVFGEDATANRHTTSIIRNAESILPLGHGLISSNGQLWKTHRRFALSTLRDLGMGKNWLEENILAEVEGICQALRDTQQQPFNPKVQLTTSVSNIICALIFGQRFALTDPEFSKLTSLIAENVEIIKFDFVALTLPFLMWFPNYVRGKIFKARSNFTELVAFLREAMMEHNEVRGKRDGEALDYLEAYEKERSTGSKMDERDTFNELQLLGSVFDLFVAGTETTSTTILWAFVFMVENPDVMRKVQVEIDSTTGRDRVLTNSDRGLLPYTEAVILEVQRFASLVPLGLPHMNREAMTIDGYDIPKDTLLVANLYSMHRDHRWWKNPNQFDTSHFLDDQSKLVRPDGFAPFSLGKRACPGEALAKMELFLFIANILRCFTLEVPPGKTVSHESSIVGLTLAPSPFELIFIPRP